jgi:hypothetical protein
LPIDQIVVLPLVLLEEVGDGVLRFLTENYFSQEWGVIHNFGVAWTTGCCAKVDPVNPFPSGHTTFKL